MKQGWLNRLVGSLIKGEKAIAAVTTTIKLLGAIIATAITLIGGIKAVNEIKRVRWEKERREWAVELQRKEWIESDSAFKAMVIAELVNIKSEVRQQKEVGEKLSSSYRALDKSYQSLLQQSGQVTLLTTYLRSLVDEANKGNSPATNKDVMFNFSIQPLNGKENKK